MVPSSPGAVHVTVTLSLCACATIGATTSRASAMNATDKRRHTGRPKEPVRPARPAKGMNPRFIPRAGADRARRERGLLTA